MLSSAESNSGEVLERASAVQAGHFGGDYDYLAGSPHLKHRHLFEALTRIAYETVAPVQEAGRIPEVLEIGAGDGSISERLLARGCAVTATEMSADSVSRMRLRFGTNDRFRALLDEAGDLEPVEGTLFDAVIFASVLHHIPDYFAAVERAADSLLREGGALVSLQDPLWYPRMRPRDLRISDACFLSWRVTQGELVRGARTRIRRAKNGVSEEAPGDVVEYHMVRNGVDELALGRMLEERFREVKIHRYWSSQGGPQQAIGERLKLANTFAIQATGRLGS